MNNDNDKQIREKISDLNTLSGGIVFGKDASWDRLQARLDTPAPRLIPLRLRLAAAAALLACVSIAGLAALYQHHRGASAASSAAAHKPAGLQAAAPATTVVPITPAAVAPAPATRIPPRRTRKGTGKPAPKILVTSVARQPLSPHQPSVAPTAPIIVARAVQINELQPAAGAASGFVQAQPPVTAHPMKAVHYNDLAENDGQKALDELEQKYQEQMAISKTRSGAVTIRSGNSRNAARTRNTPQN